MTFSTPNPGGQNRRAIRRALAAWLTAQHIQGLDHVYSSRPPEVDFTEYVTGTSSFRCDAYVFLASDEETRLTLTGPVLPTGKIIHYRAVFEVWHRVYELGDQDWADAEDDYDRIIEAIKDGLRAQGRTAGRPELIFSLGEFRSGITTQHALPEMLDGGTAQRNGTVEFEVTQTI